MRISRILVSTAVVAALASGCSSVTTDAVDVDGRSLSKADFEELLDGYADAVPSSRLDTGAVSAPVARGLLTDWITTQVLAAELDRLEVEVSADDLAAARASLTGQQGFSDASATTQSFYELATAVRDVFARTFGPTDDELRSTYEGGPAKSGVYCMRGILTDSREAADAAALRVAAGEDFATVAREVSTDASGADGGILRNTSTGLECLDQKTIDTQALPEFAANVGSLTIGAVSVPFEIADGKWLIVHLRPFDEVADDVRELIGVEAAAAARAQAIATTTVHVSSEYGRWDPTTGQVVSVS